jgi:hypothetical protein
MLVGTAEDQQIAKPDKEAVFLEDLSDEQRGLAKGVLNDQV